jgi:segregation and condensation protein B
MASTTAITAGILKGKGKRRGGQAASNGHAVRAVVQILLATGKSYTIETLREKSVASFTSFDLVSALLESSSVLDAVGLQIRLVNGTAQLVTTKITNARLREFISEHSTREGAGELSQAALEVVSCIAFKQPISQAEIDLLFGDVDKRHVVNVLRESGLIEFVAAGRRLQFVTTGKFLQRFGLESLDQLRLTMSQT